jgi:hypothetical protein
LDFKIGDAMKNKYVPLDEITALTARCEAAEKERDELQRANEFNKLRLNIDLVVIQRDALREKLDIATGALKQIQHGDDTAPETMRRAAKEALIAIGAP